jgi:hypothetical protein
MLLSRGSKVKSEPSNPTSCTLHTKFTFLFSYLCCPELSCFCTDVAIAQTDVTSIIPSCSDVSVFVFIVPPASTKAHRQYRGIPSIAIHRVLTCRSCHLFVSCHHPRLIPSVAHAQALVLSSSSSSSLSSNQACEYPTHPLSMWLCCAFLFSVLSEIDDCGTVIMHLHVLNQ